MTPANPAERQMMDNNVFLEVIAGVTPERLHEELAVARGAAVKAQMLVARLEALDGTMNLGPDVGPKKPGRPRGAKNKAKPATE